MSHPRVKAPVVAIIGWRAAAALKDNATLLRRAGLPGSPRAQRSRRTTWHRSLIVRADGSGELQRFTAATMARRLTMAVLEMGGERKAGTEERG